jgi:cytosine/adenosine deaminase-related metal-dependent hydrolase
MTRPILIAGGRVLDPEGELHQPPAMDILIEAGRIAALGEAAAARASAVGAEIIDAAGQLITPGFVNAHSHSHDVLLRGLFEQEPLEVWGLSAFPSAWPRRPVEEIAVRTQLHAAECLRGGITTLQDMVTIVGPDEEHASAIVDVYGRSGLRCVLAIQFADLGLADAVPFLDEVLPAEQVAAFKRASDPAPMQRYVENLIANVSAARLTWGLGPSAPQRCSEALLAWTSHLSQERGLPLFTHVYETRTQAVHARIVHGGSLLDLMQKTGLLNPRTVIAHGVWMAPNEIDRLGAAGVQLACNPVTNLKLLNGAAPVKRYAQGGVRTGLGCDNSSGNDTQNIFQSMKLFALWWALQSEAGETGAATQAFRAATIGGADAVGLGGQVGRIRPGYRADLLLFDLADPVWKPFNSAVRQLVYGETGRALRTVMVDGEVVVRGGHLLTVDERAMNARIDAIQDVVRRDLAAITQRSGPLAAALRGVHERAKAVPLKIDPLRLAPVGV